ncbi:MULTISPECIES: magnesium transporter [unclassified Bacteroides]|jgi:magnesium transporter|uniref:magnesium transporter n=1 Tax=unclassified Bacteroides TaxID=2646097 RepID=UPI000E945441|nr:MULTISPECIES: magnesium transporter [unclassified Bacteroides]RGN48628.1 magnesium transporter [Bacteroides sp. OM05-12]RHR75590.1 magnesium transporter [Bacteroides sp. AF16-49]
MTNEINVRFQQLLNEKNWKLLKEELNCLEPLHIADVFDELSKSDQILLFRLLPRKLAKETFEYLPQDRQKDIVTGLAANVDKITNLLNDLEPDDRTAFFEELPGEVSQRLVQLLSDEEREITTRLLGYPKDSIGRLMTPEYVAVKSYFTVQQALDHIRKFGRDSETLDVIYIVDERWKLIDDIRIKELILASPSQQVSELCDNRFVALNAYEDQERAVKMFQDYDRMVLPVTDLSGTLLGIVTVDDVLDVVEEENTEDFQKFGGTEGLDLSYTKTSLGEMVKKRAGWLVLLFIGEMLTASAMGYFDEEISKAVVLALFVPLIISSGGNSGSQAASLIIRSLALDELRLKNWWYVMKKEILSGLLLGTILAVIGFIRILIWQKTGIYDYGEYWLWIGASVSVSLIFIVLWGTISGSMIPFILKRCGLDPATASAPFVATLVDVTGLIIYFTVAALFLGGKLL